MINRIDRQATHPQKADFPPCSFEPSPCPDLLLPNSKPHTVRGGMSCHLGPSPATTFFQIWPTVFYSIISFAMTDLPETVRTGPLSSGESVLRFTAAANLGDGGAFW